MDASVLARVGAGARVAVTALAGSRGRDYLTATANGVRWWTALGADAIAAPDAREDEPAALDVLEVADLVVLPRGSPARLRAGLLDTAVGALLAQRWKAGECALLGASAGAMLLCSHTVLPDRAGQPVVSGLGLLPHTIVVPHWSGASGWLQRIRAQVPEGTRVLGLPECSGVVVDSETWTALGTEPSELVPGDVLELGQPRRMR
jgi:cyanophycinase-like exopeptidase